MTKIAEKSEGISLRVLIIGSAGSGKTTLCHKISHMWADQCGLFGEYALVLHCPLRAKEIQEAGDIKSLVQYFYKQPAHLIKQVSQWLSDNEGRGLLILFDGWDEFQSCRKNSFIHDIIEMKILGRCDVIITSRRHASYSLVNNSNINRQFELLGFSDKEIEICISRTLNDDLAAQKLIDELAIRPYVQQLCRIPLLLSLVLFVFDKCDETLPGTSTELYTTFVKMIIQREFTTRQEPFTAKNLQDLFRTSREFQEICEFAYKNLCTASPVLSFHDYEVQDSFSPLALDKRLVWLDYIIQFT